MISQRPCFCVFKSTTVVDIVWLWSRQEDLAEHKPRSGYNQERKGHVEECRILERHSANRESRRNAQTIARGETNHRKVVIPLFGHDNCSNGQCRDDDCLDQPHLISVILQNMYPRVGKLDEHNDESNQVEEANPF